MGKIDYINASPVYYGLDNGLLPDWIKMVPSPPAVLNGMIRDGKIAMSPVSSAFYGMNHKELLILPDLSISSHGDVMSVVLMSNYPLDDLHGRNIMLTRESATSVCLVKLIMAQKQMVPEYRTGKLKCIEDVPEDVDAAMIIGDAAMTQPWESRFKYRFDLGQVWHKATGLPFVYALWVVQKKYAQQHPHAVAAALDLFYQSRRMGYDHIRQVIKKGAQKLNLEESYVDRYFKGLICDLDAPKIKGLTYFFDSLYRHGIFSEKVDVQFFAPYLK
ncbi:menaquinone biosynthetic enzyme MqnA/MqnD family protein [Desulfocicer vacuolatum]|nr:menaquinone biosynthesis protein [Desulfocicer vacuolatum]